MTNFWNWQTASAPAAIALVQVPAVPALIDRPLPAVGQARFACLRHKDGRIIDEVVVTRLSSEVLEIACHGGPGMRSAIELACRSHDLIAAPDNTAPGVSMQWLALSQACCPAAVSWLLTHKEHPPAFSQDFLYRHPVVLITGPTNAGKSTLLNAWCGHQRALVSDIPGTTRDLIAGQTLINGWRFTIIDSAGLRPDGDELEQAGQALVSQARQSADVVLYLRPPGDVGGEPGDFIVDGKADMNPHHGTVYWSHVGVGSQTAAQLLQDLGRALLARLQLPGLLPNKNEH